MRSSRYKKLMEGSKHLQNDSPIQYEVKISEGVICRCELQIWNYDIFHQLEHTTPIKQLLFEFKDWIELPGEILGKKSSEVVVSKSQQYCLKTIGQQDLQTFTRILPQYLQFKHNCKQSLLIPILAVLNLSSQYQNKSRWTDSFIIMPNLKPKQGVVFDIKGHTDSRLVEQADFKDFRFGKDENFIRSHERQLLLHSPKQFREAFYTQVEANIQFLKACRVIDYSLLLVFSESQLQSSEKVNSYSLGENCWVHWALIDFLQVYNERKKLQNKLKSLFHKEISSVDPESYATRLLQFLRKTVLTA